MNLSCASWESGGCLCGACRYTCRSPLAEAVFFCLCNICKRWTGGAFATLFKIERAEMKWLRESISMIRSSPIAIRASCNSCGSPLFLRCDNKDVVYVTAGSLDEPENVSPKRYYGTESRLSWADIGLDLPEERTKEHF